MRSSGLLTMLKSRMLMLQSKERRSKCLMVLLMRFLKMMEFLKVLQLKHLVAEVASPVLLEERCFLGSCAAIATKPADRVGAPDDGAPTAQVDAASGSDDELVVIDEEHPNHLQLHGDEDGDQEAEVVPSADMEPSGSTSRYAQMMQVRPPGRTYYVTGLDGQPCPPALWGVIAPRLKEPHRPALFGLTLRLEPLFDYDMGFYCGGTTRIVDRTVIERTVPRRVFNGDYPVWMPPDEKRKPNNPASHFMIRLRELSSRVVQPNGPLSPAEYEALVRPFFMPWARFSKKLRQQVHWTIETIENMRLGKSVELAVACLLYTYLTGTTGDGSDERPAYLPDVRKILAELEIAQKEQKSIVDLLGYDFELQFPDIFIPIFREDMTLLGKELELAVRVIGGRLSQKVGSLQRKQLLFHFDLVAPLLPLPEPQPRQGEQQDMCDEKAWASKWTIVAMPLDLRLSPYGPVSLGVLRDYFARLCPSGFPKKTLDLFTARWRFLTAGIRFEIRSLLSRTTTSDKSDGRSCQIFEKLLALLCLISHLTEHLSASKSTWENREEDEIFGFLSQFCNLETIVRLTPSEWVRRFCLLDLQSIADDLALFCTDLHRHSLTQRQNFDLDTFVALVGELSQFSTKAPSVKDLLKAFKSRHKDLGPDSFDSIGTDWAEWFTISADSANSLEQQQEMRFPPAAWKIWTNFIPSLYSHNRIIVLGKTALARAAKLEKLDKREDNSTLDSKLHKTVSAGDSENLEKIEKIIEISKETPCCSKSLCEGGQSATGLNVGVHGVSALPKANFLSRSNKTSRDTRIVKLRTPPRLVAPKLQEGHQQPVSVHSGSEVKARVTVSDELLTSQPPNLNELGTKMRNELNEPSLAESLDQLLSRHAQPPVDQRSDINNKMWGSYRAQNREPPKVAKTRKVANPPPERRSESPRFSRLARRGLDQRNERADESRHSRSRSRSSSRGWRRSRSRRDDSATRRDDSATRLDDFGWRRDEFCDRSSRSRSPFSDRRSNQSFGRGCGADFYDRSRSRSHARRSRSRRDDSTTRRDEFGWHRDEFCDRSSRSRSPFFDHRSSQSGGRGHDADFNDRSSRSRSPVFDHWSSQPGSGLGWRHGSRELLSEDRSCGRLSRGEDRHFHRETRRSISPEFDGSRASASHGFFPSRSPSGERIHGTDRFFDREPDPPPKSDRESPRRMARPSPRRAVKTSRKSKRRIGRYSLSPKRKKSRYDAGVSINRTEPSAKDSRESNENAKSSESRKSCEKAKASESRKSNEKVKSSESRKSSEKAKASESRKSSEKAKFSESRKSNEKAKASESRKSREKAKSNESRKSNEKSSSDEGSTNFRLFLPSTSGVKRNDAKERLPESLRPVAEVAPVRKQSDRTADDSADLAAQIDACKHELNQLRINNAAQAAVHRELCELLRIPDVPAVKLGFAVEKAGLSLKIRSEKLEKLGLSAARFHLDLSEKAKLLHGQLVAFLNEKAAVNKAVQLAANDLELQNNLLSRKNAILVDLCYSGCASESRHSRADLSLVGDVIEPELCRLKAVLARLEPKGPPLNERALVVLRLIRDVLGRVLGMEARRLTIRELLRLVQKKHEQVASLRTLSDCAESKLGELESRIRSLQCQL